ncbi:unnamed protein product [Pedinophyceae sp. YPF-701]|nr:unnamed protein product [Pedinophyceae sp. YPF-701]
MAGLRSLAARLAPLCRSFHSSVAARDFVPIVVDREEGMFERAMDIYSRLLRDRVVMLYGPVHELSSRSIVAQLLFLEADDSEKPIELYINSPGGEVMAGMAIYDTMQFIKCPVHTTVVGRAFSMGSLLLAGGEPGQRRALPNSKIMIHQPLGGAQGSAADVKIAVDELLKTRDELHQLYVKLTGQDLATIEREMDRDKYFKAEDAMRFGLIDQVLDKRPEPPAEPEHTL